MKSKTLALILLCCAASLGAKVKLPALVGDNMILQQQTEVKLWGTAAPKAEVRVTPSWNGQTSTCRADKDGRWMSRCPACRSGSRSWKNSRVSLLSLWMNRERNRTRPLPF